MTYKESLTAAMEQLAIDPKVIFVGYGLLQGRAAGTLKNVPAEQIIETPVAENLMVGIAIGLSLMGRKPVVFIERMDFLLNALDAIVNHLDKIKVMSHGEFAPAIILRVVVGNKGKPLFTGKTHVQDFSDAVRHMVKFPVVQLNGEKRTQKIPELYVQAYSNLIAGVSTMLVEYKEL